MYGHAFGYTLDFKATDFRRNPELYRMGIGEQGVLLVEPYKGEILPHWKFRTPAVARESSARIFALYEDYKAAGDFAGMDMARKFLQMGVSRARRYANHVGGRKYRPGTREELPKSEENAEKAESARIFRERLEAVKADPEYRRRVAAHKAGLALPTEKKAAAAPRSKRRNQNGIATGRPTTG